MKVSLITVCFNSADTIRETLESVRAQTLRPIEYIIVDGGSTDETLDICNEFDDIITNIISEPDEGIYDAMNKGVSLSSGEIIALLNSDDCYSSEEVLATAAGAISEGYDVFCAGVNYVNKFGQIVRSWRLTANVEDIAIGWHPPHPSFFAKRNLYERFGNYNLDYTIAADFDLMIRFIVQPGVKVKTVPEPLVNMKLGGESNTSIKNILLGNAQIRHSLRNHGFEVGYWYTIRRLIRKVRQHLAND